LFAEAKRKAGFSEDTAFDLAMASLKKMGLVDLADPHDRFDAQDIVLQANGFFDVEELSEELQAYPDGKAPLKLRAASAALGILAGNKRRPTLSLCLSKFLEDKARGQDLSKKRWINYERERKRIMGEVIKLIGNKTISAITRQDARSFVTKLEDQGYSPASVEKQTAFLRALVDWAKRELGVRLEGENPFERLKIALPAGYDGTGVSFEYEEVRELLDQSDRINDELQDIVRLLASTGARLAEITGLEVRDFADERIPHLNIRPNGIRPLKNAQSKRTVPIVDKKVLDALNRRTKGRLGTEPVFPRYGWDKGADSASAALSKWLTTIGLRDPEAEKPKTTHSLRHTFKDALRDCGVIDDIRDMIQGHTDGQAADDYGSLELLERKREACQKVWRLLLKKPTVKSKAKTPAKI
jgi:integrase